MDWVKMQTRVVDHPRFLAAGATARDLWEWGMLYSGAHELDGELPRVSVLASPWGAGPGKNAKVASKLVEVGLWEITEAGYRILRWSEQGNLTAAELVERRACEREKKAGQRRRSLSPLALASDPPIQPPAGCPSGTPGGTPLGSPACVLNSTSLSGSLSGSPEGMQGEVRPALQAAEPLRRDAPLTPDARQVFDAVAMARPVGQDVAAVWLAFTGHYADQLFPSREAVLGRWQKWVGQQAAYAQKDRVRDADREAAAAERRRFAQEGPRRAPAASPAEARRFASELADRVMGKAASS